MSKNIEYSPQSDDKSPTNEQDHKLLGYITDDCGNYWPDTCPDCGAPMQIIRPGDCRCSAECYIK